MSEVIPKRQKIVKAVLNQAGDQKLGDITVAQAYGGMRGVRSIIHESSLLDINKGIKFHGLTLDDIQNKLPTAKVRGCDKSKYALPEAMLWLILTGDVPTELEAKQFSELLTSEPLITVPKHTRRLIDNLPVHQHPIGQYITAIMSLQTESTFAMAYKDGVHRSKYWEYALIDTLSLIAKIPYISARIYRQTYHDGHIHPADQNLDWSANFTKMIGLTTNGNDDVSDLMRLYFTIHTDHEGGNVSAHATKLVGSALSDPYIAYAAGMCGLGGPLHGLANQECLRFIQKIKRLLGDEKPTKEFIQKYVIDLLESGQVVPGFGHAVLRVTDPRFIAQQKFAKEYLPNNKMCEIVDLLAQIVPPILKEWQNGKVSNPWPNCDAHSGCLLHEYGLREESFHTVVFGMSRSMGILSSLITDRYLNLPIERPKSVTTESIQNEFKITI